MGQRRRRHLRWIAGIVTVVVVIVVGLFVADSAVAIRAERAFARAIQAPSPAPSVVTHEPEVTLSGFPAYRHVASGAFPAIGITARSVNVVGMGSCTLKRPCHADVRAHLGDAVRHGDGFSAATRISARHLDVSTTLDSVSVGRFLGIDDLTINTYPGADTPGGGGPQDGLVSATSGIVFTGSVVPGMGVEKIKVSVTVDVAPIDNRLHIQATGFYTGPNDHAKAAVSTAQQSAVLAAFTATLPPLPMPWSTPVSSVRSSGSDLMLDGRRVSGFTDQLAHFLHPA